ncbi:prolyl-tRNA synthetase, partial [Patescibacteria group bacterium]|nr:prolyl-tRNA synthetase [Patescibacteria group bacterium]
MRQSQLFTKTQKTPPKEEGVNAQLLMQAGFVHKEMAGVYSFLPLGLLVFNKIVGIIREEMNAIGGQELQLTSLQDPELWEKTGRWSDTKIDIWFKTKLKNKTEIGLANTHEEPMTNLLRRHISSWRDLPVYIYQFQTKFRNELRARNGLLRTREFVMKDLYSFSKNQEEHDEFYMKAKEAYGKIFSRLGIGKHTLLTFASGGSFSEYSHEFQTVCDAGEDTIYLDRKKKLAVNEDVLNDEVILQLGLKRGDLEKVSSAEVGNIFNFGTTKSEQMGLQYTDKNGERQYVVLGSYGIGVTRVIGVIAELMSDDKGLVWPDAIAPYRVHLLSIGDSDDIIKQAEASYVSLTKAKVEVLYDDIKDVSAGTKFANSDLIGIPNRLVVSNKSIRSGGIELKRRDSDKI